MSQEPSNRSLLVAAVQMASGQDKAKNLASATRLVEQASESGAELIVLPEYFNCLGNLEAVVAEAEPIPGPTSTVVSRLAARLKIWLVAGTLCERTKHPGMGYNTSLVFDPSGREVARYRKIHLFDVDLANNIAFQESKSILPGDQCIGIDTAMGRLGIATCYDLRFPELFRTLADQGMEILVLPAAFLESTGRAHWEILLRARAIENQVFLIAANQATNQTPHLITYGHSMIIDPWGDVLASCAGEPERILTASIDPRRLASVRKQLPALKNRRCR